jgi:hypothetical protein
MQALAANEPTNGNPRDTVRVARTVISLGEMPRNQCVIVLSSRTY